MRVYVCVYVCVAPQVDGSSLPIPQFDDDAVCLPRSVFSSPIAYSAHYDRIAQRFLGSSMLLPLCVYDEPALTSWLSMFGYGALV